jgi:hypothetical protein
VQSLRDQEVLIVGNYNKTGMDRTVWYAFSAESIFLPSQIHSAKMPNASGENARPIPEELPKQQKKPKEGFHQDSPPLILATLLLTEHRKNDGNFLTAPGQEKSALQRWAKDIDKILRLDHRTAEEVRAVIVWCQTPGCFWVANILSGAKLREKFPTLLLQSTKDKPKQADDSWRFVDPREERLRREADHAI